MKDSFHAIFYEQDIAKVIKASRDFIEQCYAQPLIPAKQHYNDDTESKSATQYQALLNGQLGNIFTNIFFGIQKLMLSFIGRLSDGMTIGLKHGFDSGASLDYVYGNQAKGKLLLGKFLDRGYLDAVGWRGIRLRKLHLQQALAQLISQRSSEKPDASISILDIAAGSGRYALETIKRFQDKNIQLTLRDLMPHNLAQAKLLAEQLQLKSTIEYQCCDAFADASYSQTQLPYDIVIVSGLYELFSDNAIILQSLQGIQKQLKPGGHIIYTAQPWHPQLVMIAKTLTNHLGKPWTMRPRPQLEMDALVASIGCKKIQTQIGLEGIFTVSVAQYLPSASRPEIND